MRKRFAAYRLVVRLTTLSAMIAHGDLAVPGGPHRGFEADAVAPISQTVLATIRSALTFASGRRHKPKWRL